MSTNKQALRQTAEKAQEHGVFNMDMHSETVLALLDELEAAQKSNEFLKEQLAQLASFNPDWDKLEAATDSIREHMVELIAARNRIAELEAREIVLPQRQEPTSSGHYGEGYLVPSDTGSALEYEDTVEALTAAGITVKGE